MARSADPLLLVPTTPRRRVRVHVRFPVAPLPERLACRICGFRGIPLTVIPGENFPTALVVTGSTYSWTSASEPLSVIDKAVTPEPNPSVSCPFCGGTRFLDGMKGQGQ